MLCVVFALAEIHFFMQVYIGDKNCKQSNEVQRLNANDDKICTKSIIIHD